MIVLTVTKRDFPRLQFLAALFVKLQATVTGRTDVKLLSVSLRSSTPSRVEIYFVRLVSFAACFPPLRYGEEKNTPAINLQCYRVGYSERYRKKYSRMYA